LISSYPSASADAPADAPACGRTSPPTVTRVLWGYRRVPLSHGRHHGGRVTLWPAGPTVRVESHEEACVVRQIVRAGCVGVASQPVTIWYRSSDRSRRYTPDLDVRFAIPPPELLGRSDDRRFLVEVRPFDQLRVSPGEWAALVAVVRAATGLPLILLSAASAGGPR
jgi:hypothetical protein